MKLKDIYQEVIRRGIEADPRGKKEIAAILKQRQDDCKKLAEKEKDFFDEDCLSNPFSDTRILNGDPATDIKSAMVGIDVEGDEFLLVDRLKEKGAKIDLVISHHPSGKAYANFYEVMDLQVDIFAQKGVGISFAENTLRERKAQVERRVSAANHQRPVDIARWLGINFICMHTPADNHAYGYIKALMQKEKPKRIGDVIALILDIPEYHQAATLNNPPKIFIGSKQSKVSNIHIEFTGGTEGPQDVYEKLSSAGVDTIIAMHQSEEHFKKCKEHNINVIVAAHIASDNLGMNLILDRILSKEKIKIYEFSGFKHVVRKGKE
ncbi:MAG: NGG1p interacting factor NIF3 [Candidatus Omnitrophota bacterium]